MPSCEWTNTKTWREQQSRFVYNISRSFLSDTIGIYHVTRSFYCIMKMAIYSCYLFNLMWIHFQILFTSKLSKKPSGTLQLFLYGCNCRGKGYTVCCHGVVLSVL